jgi:hypothetical protein
MAKKVVEHKTEVVNQATGEVTETTKTVTIRTDSQEEFFQMYIQAMTPVFKVTSLPAMKLLMKMCQLAIYNTGEVYLPQGIRAELCEELGMRNNQITNILADLKKLGLVTGEKGVFIINPYIAWKGEKKVRMAEIKKMELNLKIQYQSDKFD